MFSNTLLLYFYSFIMCLIFSRLFGLDASSNFAYLLQTILCSSSFPNYTSHPSPLEVFSSIFTSPSVLLRTELQDLTHVVKCFTTELCLQPLGLF